MAQQRALLLETYLVNKTKAIFVVGLFGSISCFPLASCREKRFLISLKRATREIELKPLFSFVNCYNFPTTEAADYLSVGTWPNSGHSFWKPILFNKTKADLVFGLFESLSCPPLASGREEVFISLKRATWKIELTLSFF